jgi:hypothetical protein
MVTGTCMLCSNRALSVLPRIPSFERTIRQDALAAIADAAAVCTDAIEVAEPYGMLYCRSVAA